MKKDDKMTAEERTFAAIARSNDSPNDVFSVLVPNGTSAMDLLTKAPTMMIGVNMKNIDNNPSPRKILTDPKLATIVDVTVNTDNVEKACAVYIFEWKLISRWSS